VKRMSKLSSIGALVWSCALIAVPALQARTCGGVGDVVGSFGFVAVRSMAFVPPGTTAATLTTPVTTSTTTAPAGPVVGSATGIGQLIAGSLNPGQFATVGRLYLDGNGGVFTSASAGVAALSPSVGSYTVNGDCTIATTLIDTFSSVSGGAVGLVTPTLPTATFEGVLVQNGDEIDLTETGSVTGTSVTLNKTKQSCSSADLSSPFGVSASGYVAGTSSTVVTNTGTNMTTTPNAPFSIVGRFVPDGVGILYVDNIGLTSPLTKREITGTFTVNADCTGVMQLITSDGTKRNANFVEVSIGPTINNAPLALELAFTDTGVVGSGTAQQQ
jgi:hypothetical protein